MIRSMTSFANAEMDCQNLSLDWQIHSVNHRFLDISIRLPENARFLESDIRSLIAKKLNRGKIECTLSYKNIEDEASNIQINEALVKRLSKAVSQIETIMETKASISTLEVLSWPGVQVSQDNDCDQLKIDILALLKNTLNDLTKNREREGLQLADKISKRCHALREQVKIIRVKMPDILNKIRVKIQERLAAISAEPDVSRLEQELVYLTQKLDVEEELDRLDAHIEEIEYMLNLNQPVGRRLDFLMQEMNREANTIGSKSADSATTRASIEMKVLIEQVREQVQNIE